MLKAKTSLMKYEHELNYQLCISTQTITTKSVAK